MRASSMLILLASPILACVGLSGCSQPAANAATAGPNTPGWTGKTFVLGNNSTVASDAGATDLQQKWPLNRR